MAQRKKAAAERLRFSPFQDIPAEFLAEWLGVSIETAKHFSAGRRLPSRPSRKLFDLHHRGKILGPEWEGWRIKGDKLIGPNGKHVTPHMLELWELVWQIAAAKDPEGYYKILEKARIA